MFGSKNKQHKQLRVQTLGKELIGLEGKVVDEKHEIIEVGREERHAICDEQLKINMRVRVLELDGASCVVEITKRPIDLLTPRQKELAADEVFKKIPIHSPERRCIEVLMTNRTGIPSLSNTAFEEALRLLRELSESQRERLSENWFPATTTMTKIDQFPHST
jgi:RNase P/RNase MRP subunit p29